MLPLSPLGPLLTMEHFLPHVGQTYRVQAAPEPVDIRLDEVRRSPKAVWMPRDPFSLVFSTPWNVLLVEASYAMQPHGGDPITLHLIPSLSVPGDRRFYHAVFN